MRRWTFLVCTAAIFLAACAETETVLEKKVLVIGIDGVRPDILAEVNTPAIDTLIAHGTYSGRILNRARTFSGPSWSSILTGVWPEKHGVLSNDLSSNNYANYPDFLSRLELIDPGYSTFAVVDWPPLGSADSGGPLLSDTIDVKLNFDGELTGYQQADVQSVGAAVRYLINQDPDASFVYIGYPDVAAHNNGARSQPYYTALETADVQVGRLVSAINRRPTYEKEDWLILVVTDHGHLDEGGHGGITYEEATVFYLASGPSATRNALQAGTNIVDIAVTAMAHLGVTIDPAWHLDGKISGLLVTP